MIEQALFPCYNTSMKNLEGCVLMKGKTVAAPHIRRAAIIILVLLSVLASVTKILTGFDIDEAYALAIPYRVLQGDRLFADMWEVHQTSFWLPGLFMGLFYAIAGQGAGVVLYMRIVTSLLHLAVSAAVYKTIRRLSGMERDKAFLIGLCYYNFLPKWMINIDFSMQQLWFFTLFAICFCFAYERKEKGQKTTGTARLWLFWAGIMLALDVLAYPGMLILYPVAVFLLLYKKKSGKWMDVLGFSSGCFVTAAVFFAAVFSYMGPGELMEAVPKVFMDGSHQYDLATKLGLYVSQWAEVLVQSAILLLPCVLLALGAGFVYKRLGLEKKWGELPFFLLLNVCFELLISGLISFAGVFVTWGPFRLQARYIIQFVLAFFLWKGIYAKRGGQRILWLLLLSLGAFAGILLASNVGPVSSSSYLVIGNLVFVALTLKASEKSGRGMGFLAYAGAVLFALSLIMCKGYYMRNTEYVPGDISQPLARIEEGPLSNIFVPLEDHKRYSADYETIRNHTTESDRVLFMGTEGLCNLYARGKIVIPTTISTPAFNAQWVEYFTLYPHKEPTVIFLAKNTVDDRRKFFVKNEFGIWIAERYDVECMEETESLCILRPKS